MTTVLSIEVVVRQIVSHLPCGIRQIMLHSAKLTPKGCELVSIFLIPARYAFASVGNVWSTVPALE